MQNMDFVSRETGECKHHSTFHNLTCFLVRIIKEPRKQELKMQHNMHDLLKKVGHKMLKNTL